MNCEQVQARLSEYLEKSLEREVLEAVESHLSSCPRCQAEAEFLAESVRRVADLPSVEPPLGFSQRVMTRVREEAERPRLWQRLFLPISVKIPIHAAALLLVGGFAVVLYQANMPPEMQLTKSLRVEQEAVFRKELKTEKKEKDVLGDMHERTTLNPEQAVKYGLVHEIKELLFEKGAELITIQ